MKSRALLRLTSAVAIAASLLLPFGRVAAQSAELTVFAAADLGAAFRQIVPLFERQAQTKVTLVLGATGTLLQQIRNGAPADLFFAANAAAIDDLIADTQALTLPDTRAVYARGRLALVALPSSPVQPKTLNDLTGPAIRRVAIANPAHAPYGLAAQQALQAAGVWTAIQPKLVYGENVQQAIQFVQSGSVDAGVVSRSFAEEQPLYWTLVDPALYAPLNQTAVVLARTRQPALARSFLDFVRGTSGRDVMKRFGFLVPGVDF